MARGQPVGRKLHSSLMEGRHMLKAIAKWAALLALSGLAQAQNVGLLLVYDNQDTLVGTLASPERYFVWTPQLYKVNVDGNTGWVGSGAIDLEQISFGGTLWYEQLDCSGSPYLEILNGLHVETAFGQVVGRISSGPYELFAIPSRPEIFMPTVRAQRFGRDQSCMPSADPRMIKAVPLDAYPNDPEVTGIQNTPYTPPLKIESRPVSVWFELFKDGFESGSVVTGLEPFDRTA
jgi:hypothetical protein